MTTDISCEILPEAATHALALPDDLLRALGRLTVEWAYLEMLVRAMLDDLDDRRDPSQRWTGSGRPMSQRIAEILKRDSPDNLKSICREIDAIATERNLLIHGVWARDTASGAFVQVIDIDGKRESRSIMSGDIDQVIAKVTGLSKSLGLIRRERQSRAREQ